MTILHKELKQFGCDLTPDQFRDIVLGLRQAMHGTWTDEELLYHPYDALRFCAAVRARSRDSLPDELVLRTLVNIRKNQRRPRGKKRKPKGE